MFGEGDSQYPGMLAVEDIGPDEPIITVPSRLLISTKTAFECETLKDLYYENPDVYGKHEKLGDDNVLNTYLMH